MEKYVLLLSCPPGGPSYETCCASNCTDVSQALTNMLL